MREIFQNFHSDSSVNYVFTNVIATFIDCLFVFKQHESAKSRIYIFISILVKFMFQQLSLGFRGKAVDLFQPISMFLYVGLLPTTLLNPVPSGG